MIRFENVTKRYPNQSRPALDGIDLNIERGEFAFIVGASGSGKSTLVRLTIREEIVSSGRLLVGGHDLRRMPHRKVPQLRRQDRVSIVVYAGSAGLVLPPTPGDRHRTILDALEIIPCSDAAVASIEGAEVAKP